MTAPAICAVIPTLDNPRTVGAVVAKVRQHVPVILIDDGSAQPGREACAALAQSGIATLHRSDRNRGKGWAVKTGFALAAELGFSHALQVDADGQHDLDEVPTLLRAAAAAPDALILGYPRFDRSAPRIRLLARRLTHFWVDLEVGRGVIADALFGCRVYPVAAALRSGTRGNRMEFDVEIVVKMVRAGVPVVNLPVGVRYLDASEGGISHFHPLLDNLRLGWMHSRICTAISIGWCKRLLRGRRR
jgi:glycosyltransferase involved in cell wall biosynthesis